MALLDKLCYILHNDTLFLPINHMDCLHDKVVLEPKVACSNPASNWHLWSVSGWFLTYDRGLILFWSKSNSGVNGSPTWPLYYWRANVEKKMFTHRSCFSARYHLMTLRHIWVNTTAGKMIAMTRKKELKVVSSNVCRHITHIIKLKRKGNCGYSNYILLFYTILCKKVPYCVCRYENLCGPLNLYSSNYGTVRHLV